MQTLWFPDVFAAVVAAVTAGGDRPVGSLIKMAELSGGGETVARALGGRPINPNTPDLSERVLLNVVEEMAIASGTPVPPVYLLDNEEGINAFAAGTTPQNAVIGVTRGTIETLKRDELQGVIAHEFSHILNGDMRLNIRLIGDSQRHPADRHDRLRPDAQRQPAATTSAAATRRAATLCRCWDCCCTSSATSACSSAT